MTTEIRFPEHEKAASVAAQMRLIEEFLDWASIKDYVFGREVSSSDTFGPSTWFASISRPQMEKLLHEFYNINTVRYHEEREQMYAEMKALNKT